MVLGWFKKKKNDSNKPSYDPTQVTVRDLVKGAFVDYNLETWEVRGAFEYDWGDDFFSDEFQLAIADETIFLSVEEDDELELTVSRKININDIEENVTRYAIQNDMPPMKITYEGETYTRHSESIGLYRNTDHKKWQELISWTYYDSSRKKILSIERWGEDEFEASRGEIVHEYEFSSIIMP